MAIPNFKAFVSSKVKGQLYGFAANVFHIKKIRKLWLNIIYEKTIF